MKICISGLTGTGKTTLGDELAKELGIEHIKPTYKSKVASDDELLRFLKNASKAYIKEFDDDIINKSDGKDCIITTWHCPWIIKDATVRIWLVCGDKERIRREAKSRGKSIEYATKYVKMKDKLSLAQYKKAYGKEFDYSIIDLTINTEKVSRENVVALISMFALLREKKKFV